VCGRAGAALVHRTAAGTPQEIAVTDALSSEAALAREAMPGVPLRVLPLREIVARFETGLLSAAAVPEPFAAALATLEGVALVRQAVNVAPSRPLFVLAAAEATIANRAAELRALSRAVRRAVTEAEGDPSAPARDVAASLGLPFDCAWTAANDPLGRTRFAPLDIEPADIEDAVRRLSASGAAPAGFHPASVVDETFAAEMAEEEGRQIALVAKGAVPRRSGRNARKKVLVVDDNEEIRRLVELKLRGEYDVVTARDGREAVDRALATQPDIVLMDVMMPRLDGIEATKLLRADGRTREIPVLALTARTRRSDFDDMIRAGACGFVTKPFYPGELRRKVSEILQAQPRPTAPAGPPPAPAAPV
jgi:CheY-like chemotaxis protein